LLEAKALGLTGRWFAGDPAVRRLPDAPYPRGRQTANICWRSWAAPDAPERVPTDVSQQFEHRAILRRRRYHLNYFQERAAFQVSTDSRLSAQLLEP